MPALADEIVLNCDGILRVDPALGIRSRAQEFVASRKWTTDQIFYGDQSEPGEDGDDEAEPCWSICFGLGLDHIKTCTTDWFADVRALADFLRDTAAETDAEFTIDVRYRSKPWYSEHIILSTLTATTGTS